MIKEIRKRDGSIAPFNRAKIITAIGKAFTAEGASVENDTLEQMADRVIAKIEPLVVPNDIPSVEKVQDLVEETLMERGYFRIAKHYILYRFEHTKERVEEVLEQIEENRLSIEKRDGTRELFSREKVKASLLFFIRGYEDVVDLDDVAGQIEREVYDGIKTAELARLIHHIRTFACATQPSRLLTRFA